ncbi:MAG TPA: hypothetical protein VFI42_14300 [Thermomicrobiaceae bacterium]|nr:hypothetical protein [Thermomicrobiaceae bacterium]
MSGQPNADNMEVVRQFDSAWNSHNVDQLMGLFAGNPVVELRPAIPGLPDTYRNTEQIRMMLQALLPGSQVESQGAREQGNEIDWQARLSSDAFRQLGLDTLTCDMRATLNAQGKIEHLAVGFPPDMVALIQGAPRTR